MFLVLTRRRMRCISFYSEFILHDRYYWSDDPLAAILFSFATWNCARVLFFILFFFSFLNSVLMRWKLMAIVVFNEVYFWLENGPFCLSVCRQNIELGVSFRLQTIYKLFKPSFVSLYFFSYVHRYGLLTVFFFAAVYMLLNNKKRQ